MNLPTETGIIQRVVAATPDSQLRDRIEQGIASQRKILRHPQRAIERLARFVEHSRAPNTLLSQWERSPDLLGSLLQSLDVDSPAVEWLIDDPDSFEFLLLSAGRDPSAREIQDRLLAEVHCLDELPQIHSSLKRFRKRESLRIAFGIELHGMSGAWAQQQISWVDDAIVIAAFHFCCEISPSQAGIAAVPIAILAHGSYGLGDTDFATPCSLVCIASSAGSLIVEDDWIRRIERFKSILESFDPTTFTVDFHLHQRLPVEEDRQVLEMQRWFEWAQVHGDAELEATLMQMRFVSGNPSLGESFLHQVGTLFLDRYRSRSEQASLASLLRKRDRACQGIPSDGDRCARAMADILHAQHQLQTILLVLQWIHGSQIPEVRFGNTSSRIEALASHGCLSDAEHGLLSQTHATARDYKLKLQIQLGCSQAPSPTHSIMEFDGSQLAVSPKDLESLRCATAKLQTLATRLRTSVEANEEDGIDEADLVFDPDPDPKWAAQVLARYGFQDVARAAVLVRELGIEDFRVLSTRRCRYFLSVIAAKLLKRIGQTPTPDRTLENLADTVRSIGAKGVLWELFRLHQPSMDLYIRLCGTSPYLVGILTSNPGMLDELVDSLMLGRLPTENHISRLLDELCRGAQEIDAIVRSFKNAMHLSIGVRDILGKEGIAETHRTLAMVADVCLQQLIERHYNALVQRYGEPTLEGGNRCSFAVIALGKLGNREPNYHSDVTILLIYEGSGTTRPIGPVRYPQPTRNDFFFHQLAQRLSQGVNRLTRHGRLFELRNWVIGQEPSVDLAWSIDRLESMFAMDPWGAVARIQWLSARPMAGDPAFQDRVRESIQHALLSRTWTDGDTETALRERDVLESTASDRNLKRGRGGTMDLEMIAQVLSLRHAQRHPELLAPGTIDSIERLRRLGWIPAEDALRIKDAYNFLRGVESGLRLMNTKARHDLPEDAIDRARLAFGLHIPDANQLLESCQHYRSEARELLVRYVGDPSLTRRAQENVRSSPGG
jgi:glutamate-ammonia-ligase adenylyltransferase